MSWEYTLASVPPTIVRMKPIFPNVSDPVGIDYGMAAIVWI